MVSEFCVASSGGKCADLGMGTISSYSGYKPRGSLARALYERQQADDYLNNFDKAQWYICDVESMPVEVSSKFVKLEPDEETLKFLERSEQKSDWILTQIWHSIAKAFLGFFMTQTSINGWLQRGSMFVVSFHQFLRLVGSGDWRAGALLDLGAGDGEVTAHLAPAFAETYVTEISHTMQTLLQKKGFHLLSIDNWSLGRKYDMISCLNLLDRCDKPLELLEQIHSALNPDGILLLALVLPFSPYVESGSSDHKPREFLPIKGKTFEQQLVSLVQDVLTPAKFELISWSRVPYLCEGDLRQSYYWLDDSILVLRPI